MRALLCRSLGSIDALAVAEIESPRLGSGQIRIQVHASGVNFPDILMVEGKYQVKPELPFIPGLEVAGIVLECAQGVDRVRPGDRVLAFARRGGGHAQEVVVPNAIVTPIPAAMDFTVAAAFPVAYGTAHFALMHRGRLLAGEVLLVLGASGVWAWRPSKLANSLAHASLRLLAHRISLPLPDSTAPTKSSTTLPKTCVIACVT